MYYDTVMNPFLIEKATLMDDHTESGYYFNTNKPILFYFPITKCFLWFFFLGEEDVTLVLGYGINMEFVLCHLSKSHRQECMELKFSPGENIYFFSLGPYPMKISG